MKFLLLISLLSLNAFSQQVQPMKDEYKDIEQMLNKMESDVEQPATPAVSAAPAPTANPEKAVAAKPAPKVESVPAFQAPAPQMPAPVQPMAKPVMTAQPQQQPEEIRSYVDEKPGRRYKKQSKIIQGVSGTSEFTPPDRDPALESEDIYHYAYMPAVDTRGFNDKGVYDGKFSHFVVTIFGDRVINYKATVNRIGWGGDVQVGYQFDLSPFAIEALIDAGVRASNVKHVNIYGIGPRVRASVRLWQWVFPYMELGAEFAKLESLDHWTYPYSVVGGGVMFRLGKFDKRAEISLHQDYNVSQILAIIGVDIRTSPQLNIDTPDCAIIKVGLSAELF